MLIEQIEVGDEVVSRNNTTGKLESESVTALTPRHQDSLVELRVEGEKKPLRPSTRHTIWVRHGAAKSGSWAQAGKLQLGDLLQTTQGNWRRVVATTRVPVHETVYNFTVDKDHDYFVGETGFLVHNDGNCDICHGNSRNSPRPAWLYGKYDKFGNFLKWGISQNPFTRYSRSVLNGGWVDLMLQGSRSDMLDMERTLTEVAPGDENLESWSGCNLP